MKIRFGFVLAAVVLAITAPSTMAQQNIQGTTLTAVPVPVGLAGRTSNEIAWAFEEYLVDVLDANLGVNLDSADLESVIGYFSSQTGFLPECEDIVKAGTVVIDNETTWDASGPRFTQGDLGLAVSNVNGVLCDNSQNSDIYITGWGPPIIMPEGSTCIPIAPLAVICFPPGSGQPPYDGGPGDDIEDIWGSGIGGDPGLGNGEGDPGPGPPPGGGGGGGGGQGPTSLAGSPPMRSDLQQELYTRGAKAKTVSSTFAAQGWRYEDGVDLSVALPGRDFKLVREYSNGVMMRDYSEFMPWFLGRGWQTSLQSWLVYDMPISTEIDTATPAFDDIDGIQVHNLPTGGSTKFYRESADTFRSGGRGNTTVTAEIVSYEDPESGETYSQVPAFVVRIRGGGIRAYYFHNEHHALTGEVAPPLNDFLNGAILFEEDASGNRWNYGYIAATVINGSSGPAPQVPLLNGIYLCGSNELDSSAWIKFGWATGTDAATAGVGNLRTIEVHRRVGTGADAREIITDRVVYKNTVDLGLASTHHLTDAPLPTAPDYTAGSRDNLMQVEVFKGINLPSPDQVLPNGYTVEYAGKITQYRYTESMMFERPDGTSSKKGELLSYTFAPDVFEWLAENATDPSIVDIETAAEALLDLGVTDAIALNDGTSTSPLNLSSSITEYYDAYPLQGQVHRQWERLGSGRGVTSLLEYEYARASVDAWLPYTGAWGVLAHADNILKPRRYATRIRQYLRTGDRTGSLSITNDRFFGQPNVLPGDESDDWGHHKTTYHWSEDIVMRDRAYIIGVGAESYLHIERFRVPFTVATAIMEPGWTPGSTDKRAWFTFNDYRSEFSISGATENDSWYRTNGQHLGVLHPDSAGEPDLIQLPDDYYWFAGDDMPYLLDYGTGLYAIDSAGLMAANAKVGGRTERWEYDAKNRLVASYVEPISSISAAGVITADASKTQITEQREYLFSDQSDVVGNRLDLVSKISSYRTGDPSAVADDIEVVEYEYILDDLEPWQDRRVKAKRTIAERESSGENGPGAPTVSSYSHNDETGSVRWSYGPDGVLTVYDRDPATGRVTRTERAASAVPAGMTVTNWSITGNTGPPQVSESLIDAAGSLLLQRDALGIETRYGYLYTAPIGSSTTTPFFGQIAVPHIWDDSGTERLAGPISVEWVTSDGRTLRQSQYIPGTSSGVPLTDVGAFADALDSTTLIADLTAASGAYDEVSRVEQSYDPNRFITSYREWYDLDGSAQGNGTPGIYEYQYTYDALGRTSRTEFPDGTIEETPDFDIADRPLRVDQGTAGSMNTIMEYFYDGGDLPVQGVGPGLLTWVKTYPDASATRNVRHIYDWRNRQVASTPSFSGTLILPMDGPVQAAVYDSFGRVVESATLDGLTSALLTDLEDGNADSLVGYSNLNVLSRSLTSYSQSGSVYRTSIAVDPQSPATEWLVSNAWYDDAGRTLAVDAPGAAVQRAVYDELGRVTRTILSDGGSIKSGSPSYTQAIDPDADAALQETVYSYFDGTAQVGSRFQLGLTESALRAHHIDDLTDGLGVDPIRSFSGVVYDNAGRSVAAVNFGTNRPTSAADYGNFVSGGSSPSLMTSVPDRASTQETMIISETEYDARGLATAVIDPLGRRAEVRHDALGRAYATIQNTVGSVGIGWDGTAGEWEVTSRSGTGATDRDANRVVTSVFDFAGNAIKKTAHKRVSTNETTQTTEFVYDLPSPALAGNLANVGGLLYEIRYPDPATGQPSTAAADVIRFGYSRLGEQLVQEDQNGTLRSFVYDQQGRMTHEFATPPPGGDVDSGVLQHRTTYDAFGRVERVQAFDSAAIDGTEGLVNEVVYGYDARGDLTSMVQAANGTAKTLGWAYESLGETNGNRKRLEYIEYPDGTRVSPDYLGGGGAGSPDDLIGRIAGYSIAEPDGSGGHNPDFGLIQYAHLGPGTVAVADHIMGGYQMDRTVDSLGQRYFGADTSADRSHYAGWDRFGRLQSQSWVRNGATVDTAGTGPDRMEIFKEDYRWNRAGNLRSRVNTRMTADKADRDWDIDYDELNRVVDARRGVADVNGTILTQNQAAGSQSWELDELGNWDSTSLEGAADQTRFHNKTNEITSIDDDDGTSRDMTYDDNGNLVKIEEDTDGNGSFDATTDYIYDAWNRLVRTEKDGVAYVAFEYNPLHWRVVKRVNQDLDAQGVYDEVRVRAYSPSWQMLEEETELDGTHAGPERRDTYFWGKRAADEILSKRKQDLTGVTTTPTRWWHYVTDHQFSVRAVLDGSSKAVHERVEYDAHGRPKVTLGGDFFPVGAPDGLVNFFDYPTTYNGWFAALDPRADLNGDGAVNFFDIQAMIKLFNEQGGGAGTLTNANALDGPDNTIGYAGYHWDAELGLWLSRHRAYDSELGRWLQRDPAGYIDGMSLYAYVMGNPFSLVDPTGLMGEPFSNAFRGGNVMQDPAIWKAAARNGMSHYNANTGDVTYSGYQYAPTPTGSAPVTGATGSMSGPEIAGEIVRTVGGPGAGVVTDQALAGAVAGAATPLANKAAALANGAIAGGVIEGVASTIEVATGDKMVIDGISDTIIATGSGAIGTAAALASLPAVGPLASFGIGVGVEGIVQETATHIRDEYATPFPAATTHYMSNSRARMSPGGWDITGSFNIYEEDSHTVMHQPDWERPQKDTFSDSMKKAKELQDLER